MTYQEMFDRYYKGHTMQVEWDHTIRGVAVEYQLTPGFDVILKVGDRLMGYPVDQLEWTDEPRVEVRDGKVES